jgi:hypothetical protein
MNDCSSFGSPPSESVQAAINDEAQLERMTKAMLIVSGWQEMLETA